MGFPPAACCLQGSKKQDGLYEHRSKIPSPTKIKMPLRNRLLIFPFKVLPRGEGVTMVPSELRDSALAGSAGDGISE